jgi:hypothetical protein
MTFKWSIWASVAQLLWLASGAQICAQTTSVQLNKLQVRLWYQETGRLSDNIAPPMTPTLWNTMIGEGQAEENANDVLFTAQILTDGEQFVDKPAVLTATNAAGKVLAKRTFPSTLTGQAGGAVLPLWVEDIACAGVVVFSARIGSEKSSFSIDFACGE